MAEATNGKQMPNWWLQWYSPATVMMGVTMIALLVGFWGQFRDLANRVDSLQAQNVELKATCYPRELAARDAALYASRESVSLLNNSFLNYQNWITDRLGGIGAKVESVDRAAQQAIRGKH